jgi:hypothetical protein
MTRYKGSIMSNVNTDFCRILLQEARADARKAKLRVPKLKPLRLSGFTNPYWEVWGPDGILWQGNAGNAYEAKAKCIEKLLEEAVWKGDGDEA